MEATWGHGFLPRVTLRNRRGVLQALGPPTLDDPTPLSLPWAVLDAPSGLSDPTLPASLDTEGVRFLVDTGAWRFAYPATFQSPKWSSLPYAPSQPFEASTEWLTSYIGRDLMSQRELGAAAYLVPGWFPDVKQRDLGDVVERVFDIVERLVRPESPQRPLVAFVGVRPSRPEVAYEHLARLHGAVSAVYLQQTPLRPYDDPPDRLDTFLDLLLSADGDGRAVIAGHLGSLGTTIRALGVAAADAGLGDAETFDAAAKVREVVPRVKERNGGGGGARVYCPEIGRSIKGSLWRSLLEVPAVKAELACRRSCCKFRSIELTQQRATMHSLRCRVEEAEALAKLPPTMRVNHADMALQAIETRLATINGALAAAGEPPLPVTHVATQRALLARRGHQSGAA